MRAAALQNVAILAGLAVIGPWGLVGQAEPIGSGGSRAPLELTTRGMLLQQWDRNRDGKIDLGEAEMARSQMRRERIERAERSRVDPITGKRPDDLFSAEEAGDTSGFFRRREGLQPSPTVPGLGQAGDRGAPRPGNERADATAEPAAPPTMTLLGPPSGLPPLSGGRGAPDAPLSSASRVLPQVSGQSNAAGLSGAAPRGGSRPFERPTSPLGTAMTGGIRAGAPAVRPGYGTSGTTTDLNAGRLLGGAPAYRGFVPRGTSSTLNAGRPTTSQPGRTTSRPPTTPRPGSTPTEFYGP